MTVMEANQIRRLIVTVASRTKYYGSADPRTVRARRQLIEAKAEVGEAEAARLRALLDTMPGGEAVAS